MLKSYVTRILETARLGDAREESYYSALEALLNEFAESTDRKNVCVTILPKKTEAGNPDFRIWDGKQKIVGYIEAKTPDKNLDDMEKTDQVKRYMATFPNFILTNFFEFRLYKSGLLVGKVRIADPMSIYSLKGTPLVENEKNFENLLEKFSIFSLPSITSAQHLAVELAKRTRFLCDEVIAEEIREEENSGIVKILGFYEAFQKYLIKGLTKEQFADLYSQTITYGLFASRMRCEGDFNRKLAVYDIPHSIGILREMFEFISLGDLPSQLEWIVDEISYVLTSVDVRKIFSEYYRNKKGEDPVFHFYETFLAEYDPEERERRGVYYTPRSVVSYIVHSIDLILREKFGLEGGFENDNVTVLDPAAGTLTFIAEAIKQAVNEFTSKYGAGGKEGFIKEHILKNFYAFELMVAPYAIGHLKISFLLEEFGHKLQGENVKFYLTNTLELEDIEQTSLPGMVSLSEESRKAGEVKKRIPILVILGNPPYSGMSANKGKWITELIKDYKYADGKPLGERNPKWLQDDYVKFIRFAQWKIGQERNGVIGYITNHSYLDNPTFRGMRQHLMKSFDEIYVLDLHGNALKKEKCPDGSKDENVFDIRQGVAISFFIKKGKNDSGDNAKVFYSEIWGLSEKKSEWLYSHDKNLTEWKEIQPSSPFYLFIPREEKFEKKYEKYWKITKIFPYSSVGIVTARDKLTIQYSPDEVWKAVQDFSSLSETQARTKYDLGRDTQDWKVSFAQEDLRTTGLKRELIVPILYRPFDRRYTYYTGHSNGFICRPRPEVMHHMLRKNLGLITSRQVLKVFRHAFVTNQITNFNLLDTAGRFGSGSLFPLYVYHDLGKREIVNQDETIQRKPNINERLYDRLTKAYVKKPSPEQILCYVYAVLYSRIYREKYAEFLKTNFPRIPLTRHYDLFAKMCKLGKKLLDLHLMESEELRNTITKFQGEGDNLLGKPLYDEKENRVYINRTQYFEGIKNHVWKYHIGGYQILYKWLKDREGKELSLEDIKHYCRVVTALKRTIEIQDEIDEVYPDVEKETIEFKESNENADLKSYTQ